MLFTRLIILPTPARALDAHFASARARMPDPPAATRRLRRRVVVRFGAARVVFRLGDFRLVAFLRFRGGIKLTSIQIKMMGIFIFFFDPVWCYGTIGPLKMVKSMSVRISITITEDTHKFLKEYRRVSGTPMAAKVKDLIANWILNYDQQVGPHFVVDRGNNMPVITVMKTKKRSTGTSIAQVMNSDVKSEFKEEIAKRIQQQEKKQKWSELENIDELRGVTSEVGN